MERQTQFLGIPETQLPLKNIQEIREKVQVIRIRKKVGDITTEPTNSNKRLWQYIGKFKCNGRIPGKTQFSKK